jgi:SAM-dependent methyltransferase
MTRSGLHYLEHLARLGAVDLHPGGARASARLLEALALRSGHRVLEVGCGTGQTLVRVGSAHQVTLHGLDSMQEMLAAARLRLRLAALASRVTLVRGDGAAGLPFAAEAFDRVYAESVLGFQPPESARALLGEVRRVLRPGGRFVANEAVWRPGTGEDTVSTIYRSSLRDFGLAQSSVGGWTAEDWIRCMEESSLRVCALEPLGRAGASSVYGTATSGAGSSSVPGAPPRAPGLVSARAVFGSALTTFLRRAGGYLSPGVLRRQREYRQRLARHSADGLHVEAYLFVLERPHERDRGGG